MNQKDLIDLLINFGLSQKESNIYLALLGLGSASASEISNKTRINRSTSYVLLEEMVKRGLIGISSESKNRVYVANPPERLVQSLEEKANMATELFGKAKSLLPELKSIYVGVGPKPKITFFDGAEGIESVYEDTLTASEDIRAFASIENMHAVLPHYFPQYYTRRANKKINIRSIFPDTDGAVERVKYNNNEARESALVPKEKYSFSPEINIYDNKIVFMSLKERFGLIIESEELAEAMKKIFDLSWQEAERLNKKNKKKYV